MKLTFEDLMDYASPPDFPITPASPDATERICDMTRKKIEQSTKKHRKLRPLSLLIAAAVLVTAFCGTTLAAYENGWFRQLFGEKAQTVEEHIVTYPSAVPVEPGSAPSQAQATVSQETSTQEVSSTTEPETAAVPKSYTADTTDFRFTLESMLAGTDTLYAVVRMEPLTEWGQNHMDLDMDDFLYMAATNISDDADGSLIFELLSAGTDASYYLVTYSGGNNSVGDIVHFELLSIVESDGEEHSAGLFDAEITDILDDTATIALDKSIYDSGSYYFDSMTVTPLSIVIEGWYDWDSFIGSMVDNGDGTFTTTMEEPEAFTPEVTVTLKDGTSFQLEEGIDTSKYGTYGSTSSDMSVDGNTGDFVCSWNLSQIVSLDEIAEITVDGAAYTLE